MMSSLRLFLRERARLALLVAIVALLTGFCSERPPPPSVQGLARMLGRKVGGVVESEGIAWEPSRGAVLDMLLGRGVLFLASRPGEPRDVYRAQVRVTLDGKPLGVRVVRNVTQTPLGDEVGLRSDGRYAAYATVAFGGIQAVSVLDLEGIREDARPNGLFQKLLLAITSYQEVGRFDGLGRSDVVLDLPVQRASLRLEQGRLYVDFGEPGRELFYDIARLRLRGAEGGQAYAARAVPQVHAAKPLILWCVDTVRAEVGPLPIAWLENQVFGARDTMRRTTYALFSGPTESMLRPQRERSAPTLGEAKLNESAVSWPPQIIGSIWKETKPGEGVWQPVDIPFLKPLPGARGKAPPYFQLTFIRPDDKRPYSQVQLIAMDMRQLELGMQAGYEDPKPLTGPPGDGRIPPEPGVMSRVVATFNGAFKTAHGAYGMMIDRRVLVPPVVGAATVLVTHNGEVGLGSWPQTRDIGEELVSFRQNLDPLVEDGVINPMGRSLWGWQLQGTSVMTQRTALCVTPAGNLYYAFAEEIDGPTLAGALRQAGCSYGIHLDMNPHHCGFVFTDVADFKKREFNLKVAHPEMQINPERFLGYSPKDFFYVMLRDPVPQDPSGVHYEADNGMQPPPAWLPAIFAGTLTMGSLRIELTSFEKGRVAWRARSGTLEPTSRDAAPHRLELSGGDRERVLAAIGLGHTTGATRYGIAYGSQPSLELREVYATLVISADGEIRILPPGRQPEIAADEEAVQLPLLADEGHLTDHGREHGALRMRGALCVTPGGRVVLARGRHDSSDALALALVRVGCQRIVELDRGSRHPAFLHRSGTATPPTGGYETSVLYALAKPMVPHAFHWKPAGAVPSRKPTGFDVPHTVETKSKDAQR